MASNDQRQTPQLYLKAPDKGSRYNLFLSNQANDAPTYGVLEFNEDEREWRIDIGALQGVPVGEGVPRKVEIYEGNADRSSFHARILHVFPSHSTVEMPPGFRQDKTISYRGLIQGLGIPPLKVFVGGEEAGVAKAKEYISKKLENTSPQPLELVEVEGDADYTVVVGPSNYDMYGPLTTLALEPGRSVGDQNKNCTAFCCRSLNGPFSKTWSGQMSSSSMVNLSPIFP